MEGNVKQQEAHSEDFAQWAIIECMGHVAYAGYAESTTVFGRPMVKLTVPEITGDKAVPSYTKFIAPNSLYAVTPVSEDFAKRMAAKYRKAPVEGYEHNRVIAEMAIEYVKKMEATEVAQILLNAKNGAKELEEAF